LFDAENVELSLKKKNKNNEYKKREKLLAMFQDLKILALVTSLERIKRRVIGV
jgi:hypothetical protein